MQKLSVLFVSEYFPPKIMGGGEINLFLIAKSLARNGVEVHVLTSRFKGLKDYETVGGVRIHRRLETGSNARGIISNLKRSAVFPKSVANEVMKMNDEINFNAVHFIGTSIIVSKKLKKLKKPMFATIESYPALCPKGDRIYHGKGECKIVCSFSKFLGCQKDSPEIGKMKNRFYLKYNPLILAYIYNHYKRLRKSLKYCKLIAISNYVNRLLNMHGHKSKVLPNALDTLKFRAGKKKSGKQRILYLGSLAKFKGPHILLKALRGLDCRCDLYGKGVMKSELKKMITEYELDAQIHDIVPYEKVPSLYAKADIVVFPSTWPEPFGRISIEAMAAGKPVVGSNIGAIPETIPPGVGIVVKPGDPEELRKAIENLIDSPPTRESMGKKGKAAARIYSSKRVSDKLIRIYRESL